MDEPRLMLGDCLERMGEIEDGSVDLVLCDLPYGTTAMSWDAVIPFVPLWDHYRRILSTRGAVILTGSQPFTSLIVMSNPKWFKYCLVWQKANGTDFLNAKHRPMKSHEDIAVFSPAASTFSRSGSMTYNPQMGDGEPWIRAQSGERKPQNWSFHTAPTSPSGGTQGGHLGRYPKSVVAVRSVNDVQNDRHGHPTQKPVALGEYLIRTYSNPGDLVLDNCVGSGSFGVAAVNTDRRFVGIERDPGYFAVASKRIADARSATPLFGAATA